MGLPAIAVDKALPDYESELSPDGVWLSQEERWLEDVVFAGTLHCDVQLDGRTSYHARGLNSPDS